MWDSAIVSICSCCRWVRHLLLVMKMVICIMWVNLKEKQFLLHKEMELWDWHLWLTDKFCKVFHKRRISHIVSYYCMCLGGDLNSWRLGRIEETELETSVWFDNFSHHWMFTQPVFYIYWFLILYFYFLYMFL